jgi:hypothetical protein
VYIDANLTVINAGENSSPARNKSSRQVKNN